MKEYYPIPLITVQEYNEIVIYLKDFSEYKSDFAKKNLFLIKAYGETARKEKQRMGDQFGKIKSMKKFCDRNQINFRSFKRHITQYAKNGIDGIIPQYGKTKGSSESEVFLPKVQELLSNGNLSVVAVYSELFNYCDENEMDAPSIHSIRRLIKRHNLIQKPLKKITPKAKKEIKKKASTRRAIRKLTPNYIKIVDKKTFNIAMYKYGLIHPLLNPELTKQEKNKIIDDIVNRKHFPLPGASFKTSRQTILRHLLLVKKYGVDGLLPKHCYRKFRKNKDQIKAEITIDFRKPWKSIKQLKNVIEKVATPYKHEQQAALTLLRKVSVNLRRHMLNPVELGIDISPGTLEELKKLKLNTHKNISSKAAAILLAYGNLSIFEISLKVNRPPRTIYRWLSQFKKKGISFIIVKYENTKRAKEALVRKNRIISILHRLPMDFNINRSSWSLQSIADVYKKEYGIKLSQNAISRYIKKTNYSWKRAKRVLTSPDPKYKEKTNLVLNTLQNLGPTEAFFFIDEAGPWQVKKYGGKSLTPKDEVKIYPQFQSAKGRVSLIGALDALHNQVTFIFIKSKNTMSVITLIKILYFKYHNYSTLNLTWDCASWHNSKVLQEFLSELEKEETGPRINIVPLPKRAQFLNVIEAVFGGVKRAVIFSSDYQSEYEMKMAISRHFEERNEFFRKNPKRAGNKIWDKEAYELGEFEGGVYKKQM